MSNFPYLKVLPKMFFHGQTLYCNDVQVRFRKRSCSSRLVQLFSLSPDRCFTRVELAKLIYNCDDLSECSPRMYQSLRQNLTKLISRTRLHLETSLNKEERPWIEFFVYNQEKEGWYFYRLKNEHLRDIEMSLYRLAS